jgi:hypothetical protein
MTNIAPRITTVTYSTHCHKIITCIVITASLMGLIIIESKIAPFAIMHLFILSHLLFLVCNIVVQFVNTIAAPTMDTTVIDPPTILHLHVHLLGGSDIAIPAIHIAHVIYV